MMLLCPKHVMEVISLRLRELEAEEIRICKDHKALLKKRAQEDELRVDQRAKEDEAWKSRLETHDREEDVSSFNPV